MCGIVGIYSHQPVASELYDSLIHLQHRGQDAAGILTCNQRFYTKHGKGLVQEIFTPESLLPLKGNMGIGHTRYPTAGGYTESDIQPLWIGNPRGIALAHNGNISNYQDIADEFRCKQHRHLNSSLDSEVLLLSFADGLVYATPEENDEAFFDKLCKAAAFVFSQMEGAYSVVAIVIGKGLIAFRDPHGIRPLVWGSRQLANGKRDIIFASESTPFYALGFQLQGDIQPGEMVYVSQSGQLYRRRIKEAAFRPCVFEYVYFARPDAKLNQITVYEARRILGDRLATAWMEKYPTLMPDVIFSAPTTAIPAGLAFAKRIGRPYAEGFHKNQFIGRTFIMPNQTKRQRSIRYKLTPQASEIEGKAVLIVDDSIVRGNTSREMVKMIREFGAKKIYFASTCPPIKFPCFNGIDIPSRQELIAANQTEEDIANFLGVDALLYQSQADLIGAIHQSSQGEITHPCMSCIDGNYFCNQITTKKMLQWEEERLNHHLTVS